MKSLIILSILLSCGVPRLSEEKKAHHNIPVKGYKLIWKDEFNGPVLDRTKWGYRGLGRRGSAYNVKEAVKLDGSGHLIIEARIKGDSIVTGMIHTENIFSTLYGYFECRASLTKTSGIWPAFWLNSSGNYVDGATPEKNGVEIDIFEYFRNVSTSQVSHSIHWGGYGATHKVFGPFYSPLKLTEDGFHVFGLEWTPEGYATFVDGVKTHTGNQLISRVPEHIILSLEVNNQAAGPLSFIDLPDRFIVDYVRVYKKDQLSSVR